MAAVADTAQPVGLHDHAAAQGVASDADRWSARQYCFCVLFCKYRRRNAAPAASSTSNSVALNRVYLTPYSQIQTLQNWLAEVLKHCPDWTSIMRYHSGREEERLEQELSMQTRADQFVQDIVTGECCSKRVLTELLCSGALDLFVS